MKLYLSYLNKHHFFARLSASLLFASISLLCQGKSTFAVEGEITIELPPELQEIDQNYIHSENFEEILLHFSRLQGAIQETATEQSPAFYLESASQLHSTLVEQDTAIRKLDEYLERIEQIEGYLADIDSLEPRTYSVHGTAESLSYQNYPILWGTFSTHSALFKSLENDLSNFRLSLELVQRNERASASYFSRLLSTFEEGESTINFRFLDAQIHLSAVRSLLALSSNVNQQFDEFILGAIQWPTITRPVPYGESSSIVVIESQEDFFNSAISTSIESTVYAVQLVTTLEDQLTIQVRQGSGMWQSIEIPRRESIKVSCTTYDEIRVLTANRPNIAQYSTDCQARYGIYWNENLERWDIWTLSES